MTKEELIKENARLETELRSTKTELKEGSEHARRNLAKTLGINKENILVYGERSEKLPEWAEIYARIGSLRTVEQQKFDMQRFERLESVVANLIKELESED